MIPAFFNLLTYSVNITPTLLTAALAGAFSGIALPLLRVWMGNDAGLNVPLILAMVVTVALPAQAFVFGPRSHDGQAARNWDKALLQRIGAWLLAAVVAIVARTLLH